MTGHLRRKSWYSTEFPNHARHVCQVRTDTSAMHRGQGFVRFRAEQGQHNRNKDFSRGFQVASEANAKSVLTHLAGHQRSNSCNNIHPTKIVGSVHLVSVRLQFLPRPLYRLRHQQHGPHLLHQHLPCAPKQKHGCKHEHQMAMGHLLGAWSPGGTR